MENTTPQHRFVKIGNIVMWSGCFGMEQPTRAVVIEIEATGQQRAKDGVKVNRVDLNKELAVFTIKPIDVPCNGMKWCYAEQIGEVVG
jgi:hypothetical protein